MRICFLSRLFHLNALDLWQFARAPSEMLTSVITKDLVIVDVSSSNLEMPNFSFLPARVGLRAVGGEKLLPYWAWWGPINAP